MAACLRLAPAVPAAGGAAPLPRWDIPARMVVGTAIVLAITEAADVLGPQLSGILAAFPVYVTVLAIFAHRLQGPETAMGITRGLQFGLFGTIVFFLIVTSTIEPLGSRTPSPGRWPRRRSSRLAAAGSRAHGYHREFALEARPPPLDTTCILVRMSDQSGPREPIATDGEPSRPGRETTARRTILAAARRQFRQTPPGSQSRPSPPRREFRARPSTTTSAACGGCARRSPPRAWTRPPRRTSRRAIGWSTRRVGSSPAPAAGSSPSRPSPPKRD